MTGAPVVSCADLARQLPALWERYHSSDEQAVKLARGTRGKQKAEQAGEASADRINATEALILATPPATLADAVAKLLMVADKLTFARTFVNGDEALEQAERALHTALSVVTAAAGVNPDDFAFDTYAPDTARPDTPAAAELRRDQPANEAAVT